MQEHLKQKLRRKRIKVAAAAVILVLAAVLTAANIHIERADYTGALNAAIVQAEELLIQWQAIQGNGMGEYAPALLVEYGQEIERARHTAQNAQAVYTEKQQAYEQLTAQTQRMKRSANSNVIEKQVIEQLKQAGEQKEYTALWDGGELKIELDGTQVQDARDISLTVGRGANAAALEASYAQAGWQGPMFTMYHDGEFGVPLTICVPVKGEQRQQTAVLYRYEKEMQSLVPVQEQVSIRQGFAIMTLTQGGDYALLTPVKPKPDAASRPPSAARGQSNQDDDIPRAALKHDKAEAEPEASSDSSVLVSSGNAQSVPAARPVQGAADESGASVSDNWLQGTQIPVAPPSQPVKQNITVTLEIRCDPLAQNPSKLTDPAKQSLVPADGAILPPVQLYVNEGDTVFDALTAVCRDRNIQIEYSYYSGFQSYYIEGINHLYEFDGGQASGWLYRVNGTFPNVSCSSYRLKEGDRVALLYTCDGGADVGNDWQP